MTLRIFSAPFWGRRPIGGMALTVDPRRERNIGQVAIRVRRHCSLRPFAGKREERHMPYSMASRHITERDADVDMSGHRREIGHLADVLRSAWTYGAARSNRLGSAHNAITGGMN